MIEDYILLEMLNEAKQVGLLYHNSYSIFDILNDNKISSFGQDKISLSRSKNF